MTYVPDSMPVLSAGRHRSPRSGGCFMELASYLAGERWSDHPKCTDPTLAELARCVNDVMPDSHRSLLAPMIPSVIGTGQREPAERAFLAARIVRVCAVTALPRVRSKARPIACALLLAQRVLQDIAPADAAALSSRPEAHAFALAFLANESHDPRDNKSYLTRAVPPALQCIVRAIDEDLGAAAPYTLTDMLARAISTTREGCGLDPQCGWPSARLWRDACALVGTVPAPPKQPLAS